MAGPHADSNSGPAPFSSARPATAVPPPPSQWKTRLLLPLAIVLAVALLMGYSLRDALRSAIPVRVVAVVMREAGQAQTAAGTVVTQAPGWIEPSPHAVTVAALRDGSIASVLALEGDVVQAGQTLATLIDADAQIALARANAEFAHAQVAHETARAALGNSAGPGPAIAEMLAQIKQLPADTARLEAKVAELALELANRKLAVERGLVAPAQAQAAEHRLSAQRAELDALRQQEPLLRARLDRLKLQLDADARAAAADLAAAQAACDQARLALGRSRITAPSSGIVMSRLVEPGSAVRMSESALFRLYDPASLQVRVDVPQSQSAHIRPGMEALIVVDALPDRTFPGRVLRVVPEADIARNTLQFKVSIDKPDPAIKPQMLSRVKFLAAAAQSGSAAASTGAVFAPTRIVGSEPGAVTRVWAVDELGRAAQKQITLGPLRHQDWIQVTQGLNPGDRLILDPPPDLTPGHPLAVSEAGLDAPRAPGEKP